MRNIIDNIVYRIICSYITSISAVKSTKDDYNIDICIWRDGSKKCSALAMGFEAAKNLRDQLTELLEEVENGQNL